MLLQERLHDVGTPGSSCSFNDQQQNKELILLCRLSEGSRTSMSMKVGFTLFIGSAQTSLCKAN